MNPNEVIIRPLCEADIEMIATDHCPPWSTRQETKDRWSQYYSEQLEGARPVGIIAEGKDILGYGSLLFKSKYPYFANIPEINDVRIYEEYRRMGLGSRLVGWLEDLAKEKGYTETGIGFGLYADYGSAQKLYFRLGYVPDGHGATYKYQPVIPGGSYPLDDDLILWLKKKLC